MVIPFWIFWITTTVLDSQRIQGTWIIQKVEVDGRKEPIAKRESEIIFKNALMGTMTKDGKARFGLGYVLNARRNPKAIDILYGFGPCISGRFPGIYTFERDQLTICFGQTKRPARFATTPESGFTLIVMKRQKPQVRGSM